MQNKKLYIIFGIVILIVAVAAFVGGRLLNGGVGSMGLIPLGPGQGSFTSAAIAINMIPAPELPTTQPDATGLFSSRQDNAITIQSGGMGMITGSGGAVAVEGGVVSVGPGGAGDENSVKVEVVITGDTRLYRDTTEMPAEPPSEGATIQQTVEEGRLDDLTSQTMLMVWGRKNGDRIIADVISYSNPVMIKIENP